MLQELGRILAALVLLVARAIGRVYHGLRYLVRRAKQTRLEAASAVPRGGRLLDIAALSVAADVFVLVEWWRRDTGPVAVPALIGLCAGALAAIGIAVYARGPVVQYALAGTEALRLTAVFAFAFAAPTAITGGTANQALGAVGLGWLIGLALVERSLWAIAARNRVGDGLRYIGFLLPPILLLALLALILDSITALVMAQLALFVAMCLAFVISTPPPRPARPPKPPKAVAPTVQMPTNEPPVQREPDSPDGSYTLYRPTSLDEPPDQQ
jgi:hypothetical protein